MAPLLLLLLLPLLLLLLYLGWLHVLVLCLQRHLFTHLTNNNNQ